MVLGFIVRTSLKFTNKLSNYNKIRVVSKHILNSPSLINSTMSYLNLQRYLKPFFIKTLFKNNSPLQYKPTQVLETLAHTFHNNSFFYNYSSFKKCYILIVGSTVPSYEYGLSYNNTWKENLITVQAVKYGPRKRASRLPRPIFLKKLKKLKLSQLKLSSPNRIPKKIYRKFLRQHPKRTKDLIRNRYLKGKFRNRNSFLRKRTQLILNRRVYGLTNPPRNQIKFLKDKPTTFPFKQKLRSRFKRYKSNYKTYFNLKKTFKAVNTVTLGQEKLNCVGNFVTNKLLTDGLHRDDQNAKKNVKRVKYSRKQLDTSVTLTLQVPSKKRTFRNIKNHVHFTRRCKKMYWRRYKIFTKSLNLKLSSKFSILSFIKHFLTHKTIQQKYFTLTRLRKQGRSTHKKWEYSKPYQFTNNKSISSGGSYSLRDIYLNKNLQPQTSYRKRNKRLQFYQKSRKKKLTYNVSSLFTRDKLRLRWNRSTNSAPKQHNSSKSLLIRLVSVKTLLNRNETLTYNFTKMYTKKLSLFKKKTNEKQLNPILLTSTKSLRNQVVEKKSFTRIYKTVFKQQKHQQLLKVILRKTLVSPSIRPNNPRLKVKLFTRSHQSFILKSFLVFFSKLLIKNTYQTQLPRFKFKKKIFSFFKPNEVRQTLLNQKKNFFLYKTIFKQRKIFTKSSVFRPAKLKQLYRTSFNNSLLRNAYTPQTFSNEHLTSRSIYNLKTPLKELVNTGTFDLRGSTYLFKRSEVRIPRVRFKPGYQRIWRHSRSALKEVLGLKFKYQKKLSRYLVRFFKKSNYYAFSSSEMTIEKVTIYTRLIPDTSTLVTFWNEKLIYINGGMVKSLKMLVYENDLIHLIVSKWYYVAYRWITNWVLKRIKRYKRLTYRKGLAGKYKLMKQRKQRSFHVPSWIHLTRYDIADIKPYLEVDYLTLSAIVVYNPYIITYNAPFESVDYRPTIHKLYNWKYIT